MARKTAPVAKSEDAPVYVVPTNKAAEDAIIAQALSILSKRVQVAGVTFTSPQTVKDYLSLKIGGLEHEVFTVLFLDSQHGLIECQEMFRGTVSQTSVYPVKWLKKLSS